MIRLFNHEPYLVCDHCGERITDYRLGIAVTQTWHFDDTGVLSIREISDISSAVGADPEPVIYLHKNCSDAYERLHAIDGNTGYHELDEHFARLLRNTGIEPT